MTTTKQHETKKQLTNKQNKQTNKQTNKTSFIYISGSVSYSAVNATADTAMFFFRGVYNFCNTKTQVPKIRVLAYSHLMGMIVTPTS